MTTKKHNAFWMLLGLLLCTFTSKGQEKSIKQLEEETLQYMDYRDKLQTFQNKLSNSSNTNTQIIPCPEGVDPSASLDGTSGNQESWQLYHKTMGNLKAKQNANTVAPVIIEEQEKGTERTNNSLRTPEIISNFGSGKNQINLIKLNGGLGSRKLLNTPSIFQEETEDNHAYSRANLVNYQGDETIKISGRLENVLKSGTLSGDIDIYEFPVVDGYEYVFNINNTSEQDANLMAMVYEGDDNFFIGRFIFDNTQRIIYSAVNFTGSIKIAILSSPSFRRFTLSDPDRVYPLGDEITYDITTTEIFNTNDRDFYKIELKKGDVFGVSGVSDFPLQVGLFGVESGSFVATNNRYSIRAEDGNPLPTEGDFGFHYVVPEDGEHIIFIRNGIGSYNLNIGVSRPGNENPNSIGQQIIFLNMAGADISLNEFFEGNNNSTRIRNLSPLESFLPNWGLDSRRDLNRLAVKITDKFISKIDSEILETGINPDAKVFVLSDFGNPKRRDQILKFLNKDNKPYSRLIIGGTERQFGRQVIGLSSAIDVGNFDLSDNGIVMLNKLSEPSTSSIFSINNIAIAEGAEKIDLIAEVVGNTAAHEAGHFLGNWHTDNTTDELCIMDKGGISIKRRAGILEGDAFGDPENVNVSFIIDRYSRFEGNFVGLNETDTNVAFALTTRQGSTQKQENSLDAFLKKLNQSSQTPSLPSISSYPNPQNISETSKLIVNMASNSVLNIGLFDIQGRKISDLFTGEVQASSPLELEIDPAQYNLESGIYVYKVVSNQGEKSHKIIIN